MIKLIASKPKYDLFGKYPGFLKEDSGRETLFTLDMVVYNGEQCDFLEKISLEKALAFPSENKVKWLIYRGLPSRSELENIGSAFDLDSLTLESIQNCTMRRPEYVFTDETLSSIIKFPFRGANEDSFQMVPTAFVAKKNLLVSFSAVQNQSFQPLIERIVDAKGKIREKGADYLAFCLLDLAADYFFLFLDNLGDSLEEIEAKIIKAPEPEMLVELQHLKRIGSLLRKCIWPMREMVHSLIIAEFPLMEKTTKKYFNSLNGHMLLLFDNCESVRETISGLLEIYLSSISNKMNEVMKILTLVATIFIPLTFIAGIYGMNFEFMPELHWPPGYFFTLGLMALVALTMVFFFRRRKWL